MSNEPSDLVHVPKLRHLPGCVQVAEVQELDGNEIRVLTISLPMESAHPPEGATVRLETVLPAADVPGTPIVPTIHLVRTWLDLAKAAPTGPWREGTGYGAIVTDAPTGADDADCVEAYGGHLLAESIAPSLRPFLCAARDAVEVLAEAWLASPAAELAEIRAALNAADLSLGASEPKNQAASLAQRVRWLAEARDVCVPAVLDSDLADEALRAAKVPGQPMTPNIAERVGTVIAERDELRLEILALRGDKAGAISERWVWTAPCWRIRGADGELLAKVATANLLAWTRNGDIETGGIEQATSIRDGMRRCEARLAGGASC